MIWAHYILQVNIYLILFYCFYKLLLAKETYFAFNRAYLVGSGILSLAIPFLRFEWFTKQEATQTIYQGVDRLTTMVGTVTFMHEEDLSFNWGKLVVLIYLSGIVFLLVRLLFKLFIVNKITAEASSGIAFSFFNKKIIDPQLPQTEVINHHEDIHIKQYHSVDVILFELLSIFLWFNPVIYLYKQTIKSIHEFLADENAAKFQGSKEAYAMLLLSKAFNVDPQMLASNFYSKSLIKRRIFMLHKQRSKKTAVLKYGMFVPLFGLTLVLSSATIRKNERILDVAAKLPIAQTITETANDVPEMLGAIGNESAELKEILDSDFGPLYKHLLNKIKYPSYAFRNSIQGNIVVKFSVKDGKLENVEVDKKIGGGCAEEVMGMIYAFDGFTGIDNGKYALPVAFRLSGTTKEILNETPPMPAGYESLKYIYITTAAPEVIAVKAKSIEIKGKDTRIIIGSKESKSALIVIDGIKKENKVLSDLNPADIEAISVLRGTDAVILYGAEAANGALIITTKPATEIKVIGFPIKPAVKTEGKNEKNDKDQEDQEKPQELIYDFASIEAQPRFPGGLENFRNFLARNMNYPKEALKGKKQGVVYVNFTIEKNGSLSDINVDNKVGFGLDEEAMRVVASSKRWIPGIQNGRLVRVKYNIPIKFII